MQLRRCIDKMKHTYFFFFLQISFWEEKNSEEEKLLQTSFSFFCFCFPPLANLQVVRQPLESLSIAHAAHNGAHEHFDGPDVRVLEAHLTLPGGVVGQPELHAQLILARRGRLVDFVAEHKERHVRQRVVGQQAVELSFGLVESVSLVRVDEIYDGVHLGVVVLPHLARRLVSAEVERLEPDLTDAQLLARGVLRRRVLRESLILQHVHQSRFAGIVQPKKEDPENEE